MRVRVAGLETRKKGEPLVVFEAGAAQGLAIWDSVLPRIAHVAPVMAYDRAGLGQSEWDGVSPIPKHVTGRLRRLLTQLRADPPYVLVGYSWGGSLARYFAGYHPDDVAGVVFVDPGPIVTQSVAEKYAPFEAVGSGREGYEAFWSFFASLREKSPPAVRAEFNVFRGLMEVDVAERDLRPMPDVPVVVIVAAKYLPLPMQVPYDPRAQFEADVQHRVALLQKWALSSSHGTLVISNHTTHAVTREDPELIIWSVKRVLAAAAAR